jgi:hypothetical protein
MARFEFKLPDIGEGVTEGEIVTWHPTARMQSTPPTTAPARRPRKTSPAR